MNSAILLPSSAGLDDPERGGLPARHPDAGHGRLCSGCDVVGDHLRRIHPVDVIGAENHQIVGLLVVDQVQRLQDRVGAAGVPAGAEALLGRHRGDVVAEHLAHPPRRGDVPVQRVRFVLRQHTDLEIPGIHQVRQHEVDQSEVSAERNCWFCAVSSQRPQPFSFAACKYDPEDLGLGHGADPSGRMLLSRVGPDAAVSRRTNSVQAGPMPRRPQRDRSMVTPGPPPCGRTAGWIDCRRAYRDPDPRIPTGRLRRSGGPCRVSGP